MRWWSHTVLGNLDLISLMEHSPAISICAQIFQKVKIKFKEIRQLFFFLLSFPLQDISCSKMTKMSLSLSEGRVTKQTAFCLAMELACKPLRGGVRSLCAGPRNMTYLSPAKRISLGY